MTRSFLAVAELEVGVRASLAEARLRHVGTVHVDPILGLELIRRSAAMGARDGLCSRRRRQHCAEKSQGKKPCHLIYSFIFKLRSGARRATMLEAARAFA
jgi:hypothetical protein